MLIAAFILTLSFDEDFQRSGGRYGGGSFSRSSGSSSRSSGSSSRSSSSSSSRSSSSSSRSSSRGWGGSSSSSRTGGWTGGGGGGSTSGLGGGLCVVVVVLVIIVVVVLMIQSKNRTLAAAPAMTRPILGTMDVSVVMLGIDWRARKELQGELDRIANSGRTDTAEGLAELLRETVIHLKRAEVSWLYAGALDFSGNLSPQVAERVFNNATSKAASKFQEEVVRNIRGQKTTRAASEMKARAEEGQGVVVVTVAVAAHRGLPDVRNVQDAARIREALTAFAALSADELAVMEVLWSPAAENDRMSTAELETLYPELKKIDPASIAGRVFCKFCASPYAAELMKCPFCGANLDADQIPRA